MLVLDELNLFKTSQVKSDIVVINIGEDTKLKALELVSYLRKAGKSVEMDYVSSSLKPQFKLADRLGAPYLIIIGEEEVLNGTFKLKNTTLKTESICKIEKLNEVFNIEGEKYAYKK